MLAFKLQATPAGLKTLKNIKSLQPLFRKLTGMVVDKYADLIVTRAQTHYLTGAALKVGTTGDLRSSVRREPGSGSLDLSVKIGTHIKYGKWWEEGFVTPRITPVNKKVLKFTYKGATIFTKYTRRRKNKARPWLYPAFKDYRALMRTELKAIGGKLSTGISK